MLRKRLPAILLVLAILTGLLTNMTQAADTDKRDCADMESYWWGVTVHKLSAKDRELVTRVVMAEAGGSTLEGMCGVAQVIRERAESWGMSAREVVTARAQFAAPYKGELSGDAVRAVEMVFDEGYRQFAGYTTHFHAKRVSPWWTKSKVCRGEVDSQVFWGVNAV